MEKWRYAAYAAMLLLLLVITADLVIVARYAMMPRPSVEAVVVEAAPANPPADAPKKVTLKTEPERPPEDTSKFPPAPADNGAVAEYWEGYYYYSTDVFENAVATGVQRSRFWFEVRRTADGTFQAACNENSGLGDARIEGRIDRATGQMQFVKSYTAGASWQYQGGWVPDRRRIEGSYGGNSGGFVLFPRRLTQTEVARYDMPHAVEPVDVRNLGAPLPPQAVPPRAPNKPDENVVF